MRLKNHWGIKLLSNSFISRKVTRYDINLIVHQSIQVLILIGKSV